MLESLNDNSYLEPPKYSRDYVYRCDICDEEIFEGERKVKSVYISNVTLSGSESGKTDFKITFDNSGEIPKLIKGETEGYVSYRGKELRVDNYEE